LSFCANFGHGAPGGQAQRIGYVQGLNARLQSRLITSSDSSINHTYDDNTRVFSLGQPFYMDMSHDNVIIAVLAALGLGYFKVVGLQTTVLHSFPHRFNADEVSSFGARLINEVWTCSKVISFDQLQGEMYKNSDLSSQSDTTDYRGFVLDNAPVSAKGLCNDAVNGFCRMDEFLKKRWAWIRM
jgi:hypothetical protein